MYRVAERFVAPQGEGALAGQCMAFVRFAGCNLRCNGEWKDGAYQPVCDTDFSAGDELAAHDLVSWVVSTRQAWVLFTGGEPALQLDQDLVSEFGCSGIRIAVETNGTRSLPLGLDHVTVSPKTAEHTLVLREAQELRYVRAHGQALPKPRIKAASRFISPAWQSDGTMSRRDLEWCIQLCQENPEWRLSVQTHKLIMVR